MLFACLIIAWSIAAICYIEARFHNLPMQRYDAIVIGGAWFVGVILIAIAAFIDWAHMSDMSIFATTVVVWLSGNACVYNWRTMYEKRTYKRKAKIIWLIVIVIGLATLQLIRRLFIGFDSIR